MTPWKWNEKAGMTEWVYEDGEMTKEDAKAKGSSSYAKGSSYYAKEGVAVGRHGKLIGYVKSMSVYMNGLPTIQVQLSSWEAAEEIIEALKGD
jgi:hypothetical protein